MTYCEDLETLKTCLAFPYHRTIAKECKDEDGIFWKLLVAVSSNLDAKDKIRERARTVNIDTYDELIVWCDIHNVEIQSVERLR